MPKYWMVDVETGAAGIPYAVVTHAGELVAWDDPGARFATQTAAEEVAAVFRERNPEMTAVVNGKMY